MISADGQKRKIYPCLFSFLSYIGSFLLYGARSFTFKKEYLALFSEDAGASDKVAFEK